MEKKEIRKIELPAFAVVGKLGHGLAEESQSVIPPLWDHVNESFDEVVPLLTDSKGTELHLWGLMSDDKHLGQPWTENGHYLAGVQVPMDKEAPAGWTRWEVPMQQYLVVSTAVDRLKETARFVEEEIMPRESIQLSGAMQEHYLPEFAEDEVELYFPIGKKKASDH